jgi:hypothetical protein
MALCLLRADVTKTGIIFVENFAGTGRDGRNGGLMAGWWPLAGGKIERLRQAEDQPTAFFKANDRRGNVPRKTLTSRCLGLVGVSTHEEAGRLNWHSRSCELNRIESQEDITMIALEMRCPSGLHASSDHGSKGNQLVSFAHNRLVDDGLEGAIRVWIVGRYGIFQADRKQRACWQILRILERKFGFRVRSFV